MPNTDQPGAGEVHADQLLTNVSIGYRNLTYIAPVLFPMVIVTKRSGIVPRYGKSAWFRDEAKELTEREAPPVSGYSANIDLHYFCRTYGMSHFIGDERKAQTDRPFDADADGTRWATDKVQLKEERLWAQKFLTTGVWEHEFAGTVDFTKWSTYATSTPISDLRTFMRAIRRSLGGMNPNTLALGDLTFDKLCDHPNFLDRIKYGAGSDAPAMVTTQLIAQLLGLSSVVVGYSVYTTDPEGTDEASVVYTSLWDDEAWLGYVARTPSLFNPSAGYKFTWQTFFGGPRYMKRRRDPLSDRGELLECFEHFDQCQTAADAGCYIGDAVDE